MFAVCYLTSPVDPACADPWWCNSVGRDDVTWEWLQVKPAQLWFSVWAVSDDPGQLGTKTSARFVVVMFILATGGLNLQPADDVRDFVSFGFSRSRELVSELLMIHVVE